MNAPHPTPEETAGTIRLYTHWNGSREDRTWDDVRKDIAAALRARDKAAFERAIEIVRGMKFGLSTLDDETREECALAIEAEIRK